jgi:hypothetical protein
MLDARRLVAREMRTDVGTQNASSLTGSDKKSPYVRHNRFKMRKRGVYLQRVQYRLKSV